ncbi:neuronal acetylcholine receptor subunit beta-2-like [Mytilus californianus]|uniref:neuronal acetylcholine receptor subunit beta-2-like n=1 Tax=Mytilus californianus TaxID=6549 RepID=UPI0022451AEB|nr:neuronal acetylcholine receptor subunit beta-2-like [Mytilus californianus]
MKNCLFIFAIFIGHAYCQTDTDAKNLLTNLFTTQSYNKLVRPTTNQSNPTTIYLEFFLYGINAFDEIQQKLTTTAYLEIYWYDELLTWTPSSYGNLADIFLPQEDIWRPDIALENGFKDLESLGSKFIHAEVDYDGLVLWKPFHVFDSKCKLDSTYFPFEKQSCNIDFIAWAFDDSEVYLEVGTDGVNTEDASDSNGQWELVSSSIVSFSDEGVSQIRATLVIKRKPLFFIINIILPIVLLSVLNIFTFQIPADIGERMGYTVTVWLSFAVFLTIISASLPQSSDTIPVLSIYIIIQLSIGTFSVLLSAWLSRIVCLSDDIPVYSLLKKVALLKRRLHCACCKRKVDIVKPCKIDQNGDEHYNTKNETDSIKREKSDETNVDWKEGIAALDFTCFWIFIIVLIISTLVMLMTTALQN